MQAMVVPNSWGKNMTDDETWSAFNINSASIRYNTYVSSVHGLLPMTWNCQTKRQWFQTKQHWQWLTDPCWLIGVNLSIGYWLNVSVPWSYLILPYLTLSYLILSYLILSYLILSYLILSYRELLREQNIQKSASGWFCQRCINSLVWGRPKRWSLDYGTGIRYPESRAIEFDNDNKKALYQ